MEIQSSRAWSVWKHKYYYLKLQPRKAGHVPVYMEITQNNAIYFA